jgi:hypothetical protein
MRDLYAKKTQLWTLYLSIFAQLLDFDKNNIVIMDDEGRKLNLLRHIFQHYKSSMAVWTQIKRVFSSFAMLQKYASNMYQKGI